MNVNNEAIYGTRANPFDVELSWGRVTRKGDDELFLLVYEKPETGVIELPTLFENGVQVTLLNGGQPVAITQNGATNSTSFDISNVEMGPAATVIKIKGQRK